MSVPLLDVNAQNLPLEEELTAAFTTVLNHGRFINGPEVKQLEDEVAAFLDLPYAIGVSSGTDALLLAFMALDLGPGDEVLCPTFTFFATAGTIARTGATPVFVDSCPVSFNVDIEDARRKVTDKTKAIVPVHLFGQSADMDAVNVFAKEHDLRVIEDGAQAIGAAYNGKSSGGLSDFGTFSFFPSKNLGGFGDGGMLVCNDSALEEKARIMRMHGGKPKYYHHVVGGNFRLDTLQAALLLVKLKRYEQYTAARQANAAYYSEKLAEFSGIVTADLGHSGDASAQNEWMAGQNAKIVLPIIIPGNTHIWNQFTLRVIGEGQRDALRAHLTERGIGSEIYYPLTMDQQPCFQDLPASSLSGCEVSHQLSGEVLSIPVFPELSAEGRDEVVAAIGAFVGE
ncbi:MAG: DegT/DnrJ/EryC1/StrS family aminotransferase [Verrucomicrobiota bacterium]